MMKELFIFLGKQFLFYTKIYLTHHKKVVRDSQK